eukprot:1394806-Amorphochlora_amoeboformis.AAC.1
MGMLLTYLALFNLSSALATCASMSTYCQWYEQDDAIPGLDSLTGTNDSIHRIRLGQVPRRILEGSRTLLSSFRNTLAFGVAQAHIFIKPITIQVAKLTRVSTESWITSGTVLPRPPGNH